MTGPHSVRLKWTKPKRPNYFARIARYNKRLMLLMKPMQIENIQNSITKLLSCLCSYFLTLSISQLVSFLISKNNSHLHGKWTWKLKNLIVKKLASERFTPKMMLTCSFRGATSWIKKGFRVNAWEVGRTRHKRRKPWREAEWFPSFTIKFFTETILHFFYKITNERGT